MTQQKRGRKMPWLVLLILAACVALYLAGNTSSERDGRAAPTLRYNFSTVAASPTPRGARVASTTSTSRIELTSTTRASPTFTPEPTPGSAAADLIVGYSPGPGVQAQYSDPEAALGDPDLVESPCCTGMVQLGQGGSIILAFADNAVVDGEGPDFQVFGESARDDFLQVDVSDDGEVWHTYPRMSESPGGLDLADLGLERIVFVRLTDLQPGTRTGAELDAVLALNNGHGREMSGLGAQRFVSIATPTSTPKPPPTATIVPKPTATRKPPTPVPARAPRVCCKICTSGKACGDSCISASKTCHQPPGCACND